MVEYFALSPGNLIYAAKGNKFRRLTENSREIYSNCLGLRIGVNEAMDVTLKCREKLIKIKIELFVNKSSMFCVFFQEFIFDKIDFLKKCSNL